MKDKYEILDQQLGCGSFGSVYLAREASSGDQVACKIVTLNSDTRKLANKPFNSASAKVAVELIVREEKMAMMPEIKILAGISHVSSSLQIRIHTNLAAEYYQPSESFPR